MNSRNMVWIVGLWACALWALSVPACGGDDDESGDDDDNDDIDVASDDDDGDDDDADGGDAAGKPESLPAFADLEIYNGDNPFNQQLPADPEIDPRSGDYIELLRHAAEPAGGLIVMMRQWSAPIYFADSNTARTSVELTCGPYWDTGISKLVEVPIPAWAEPSDDVAGEEIPDQCEADSDEDNHMIVFDLDSRCEYDMWQVRKQDGKWIASWANATSLDGDGIYHHGLSTRASGFTFTGGVIWPDELINGEISHGLAFSYPYTRVGGPVAPALETDGITADPDALPMGARLRLDPDVDLGALDLSDAEYAVAEALQTYGAWLVDTGGESGVALYAVAPQSVQENPYTAVLPEEDGLAVLRKIPLDRLQVLKLPPQHEMDSDNFMPVNNDCAHFE